MSVLGALIAPHPPLLIPGVGGASLDRVRATSDALREASRIADRLEPETIVFISPHAPGAGAHFSVNGAPILRGSFAQFGAAQVEFEIDNDIELADAIVDECEAAGVPARVGGGRPKGCPDALGGDAHGGLSPTDRLSLTDTDTDAELDWGVMVPYYYMGGNRPIVSISISALDYRQHRRLGAAVSAAADALDRRVLFVAGGDLSHRLTADSPYGFSPAGKTFDELVRGFCSRGELDGLADIDSTIVADAAECGLRSFVVLAGVLAGRKYEPRILAYEGPFGVGYLTAAFIATGDDDV